MNSVGCIQNISVSLNPKKIDLPEKVVDEVSKMEGRVTVYCWYAGPDGLPEEGASFMTDRILRPLIEKKSDVELCLYSLEEWSFRRCVADMEAETELTRKIALINNRAIQALSSGRFFQFCKEARENEDLSLGIDFKSPEKKGLMDISSKFAPSGKSVEQLFGRSPSLLDSIRELDVVNAYSAMQYLEGYYLVRRLVLKAIGEKMKTVQAVFVLPNDEGKYYKGFKDDLEVWLKRDLGESVETLDVRVSFLFFKYRKGSSTRPYLTKEGGYVPTEEIPKYLTFKEPNNSELISSSLEV